MAKKSLAKPERHLNNLLIPNVALFCEDVAQGQDSSFYLTRIIDLIGTPKVPVTALRFTVYMEFEKAENVFDNDIRGLELNLRLTSPDGKAHDVGTIELAPNQGPETDLQRIIMNIPGITFKSFGVYKFSLHITDGKSESLLVARKLKIHEIK